MCGKTVKNYQTLLFKAGVVASWMLVSGSSFANQDPKVTSKDTTINLMCGSVGKEQTHCKKGAELCSTKLGFTIKPIPAVNGSNERLALYSQFFAAKSSDIDVFQVDVTWPGLLEPHLSDLKKHVSPQERAEFVPLILMNNTINNKVLALPWFIEISLLYYRKDLLDKYKKPVPSSWEELFETAAYIQNKERSAGRKNMWGLVFQGKAYEGLTVNAMEWINGFGTNFYDDGGSITVNTPEAKKALKLFSSNIGKTIPTGVLNYNEEETRGVFQSGNAVFMRNWPYAFVLSQAPDSPVKNNVGLALLPKGGDKGRNVGSLGGWQLAVSKYSKKQEKAALAVKCMTSYEEQKRRALEGGYMPTKTSLHKDQEVAESSVYLKHFGPRMDHLVHRPAKIAGRKYSQISAAIWNAFHQALVDGPKANVDKILDALAKKLKILTPKKK